MSISRTRIVPDVAEVVTKGPHQGTVRIKIETEYTDSVTGEVDRFSVVREYGPGHDISGLPKPARDFITAIRTHFGV